MSQTVAERRAELYAQFPALAEMAKTSTSWASVGQQVVERLASAGVTVGEISQVVGYVWQAKNMEDEALAPKISEPVTTPDGKIWEYHRAEGWHQTGSTVEGDGARDDLRGSGRQIFWRRPS